VKLQNHIANFFAFLILYNYIIPISLYVTIEMHKFIGAFFLEWDQQLYDKETDQPCIVNTSDLNEELGQVNILFSDKTGTLTKNEMIFQQCSISGRRFAEKEDGLQEYGKSYPLKLMDFSVSRKKVLTLKITLKIYTISERCSNLL
jgi:phospholipid-translocating ATPase